MAEANEVEKLENNENPVKQFFDKKGEESQSNLLKGGAEVLISLTDKVLVEFTQDYGYMKKGDTQELSIAAYEVYNSLEVIKKI